MKYRQLGRAGLRVSEIALGSWMTDVSDPERQELAAQSIQLAYQHGVNFFDCADAYSGGAAERFLGKALHELPRKELVLSSKVFFPTGEGTNDRGLSRKHIMESIDQGKILYYGVSEWTPVQLLEAELIIAQKGLHPLSVVQPEYNMFDRYIEHELIDLCGRHGWGIVCFSPLAQGLLTGKYQKGKPVPAGSRATYQDQIRAVLTDENLDRVGVLIEMAKAAGADLADYVLAWALRDQRISSLITGASKPAQLESNLRALDVHIPASDLEKIDQLFGFKKFQRQIG